VPWARAYGLDRDPVSRTGPGFDRAYATTTDLARAHRHRARQRGPRFPLLNDGYARPDAIR
jgi:hypothetical protein